MYRVPSHPIPTHPLPALAPHSSLRTRQTLLFNNRVTSGWRTFVTLCVVGIQVGYVMFSAFLLWKGEASDGAEEREIEMFALTSAGSKSKETDNGVVQINPSALAITPTASLGRKKKRGTYM